jgi:PTH1 family peptidyl-tRNA hydrolase
VKERVHGYVLSDFGKDERPWVEALCDIIAADAELLAKGQDASFQNKVHLAMQAKGFFDSKEPDAD